MTWPTKSNHLIINADDFGYNANVNAAIIESFRQGLCSSATIMANMPGFEEACQLCQEHHLETHIGMHLVLSEGTPLTEPIKYCNRICSTSGKFREDGRPVLLKLSNEEKVAIFKEIEAQLTHCKAHGLQITHFDSHEHVHVEWGVGAILLKVATIYGIRFIRMGRSIDKGSSLIKNLYRRAFNLRLKLAHKAATRYFGTVEDYIRMAPGNSFSKSFEVVIHPAFNAEGQLIDHVSNKPLDKGVTKITNYNEAISFHDI